MVLARWPVICGLVNNLVLGLHPQTWFVYCHKSLTLSYYYKSYLKQDMQHLCMPSFLSTQLFLVLHFAHYYNILHSFLHPVNCSDPTFPIDGSIEPYQNTTEGAEILIGCNPMFVPVGRMTAVCGADGRWNPDPGDLVCTCKVMW